MWALKVAMRNETKTIGGLCRQLSKRILADNLAYLRLDLDNNRFWINFNFRNSQINIRQEFTFQRCLDENVSELLHRVHGKVSSALVKKHKKKNKSTNEELSLGDVELLKNNEKLVDLNLTKCRDLFCGTEPIDDLTLKVYTNSYKITINTPWIENCTLPVIMLANCIQYPRKMLGFHLAVDEIDFSWYKSNDLENWDFLSDGYSYYTNDEDVGSYLKLRCLPKNENGYGPVFEVLSKNEVEKTPQRFPFESRFQYTKETLSNNCFRVVSYNILASLYTSTNYSKTELFSYCPESALDGHYRRQLILKELLGYNSDIICLQEVDTNTYDVDLSLLQRFSYEGDFCKKYRTVSEGCACFFKTSRFQLLEKFRISYSDELKISNPSLFDQMDQEVLKKFDAVNNCLQVLVLKSKDVNEILVVANTHLYFQPEADQVRYLQSLAAIIFLENQCIQLKKQFAQRISILFAGDFNSTPDCAIFDFFTNGKVSDSVSDWNQINVDYLRNIKDSNTLLMKSACGKPKYTNFTPGFAGCLDYIFCDKNNLDVVQVVPMLSEFELSEFVAIPSQVHPSDHIALVADLKWI